MKYSKVSPRAAKKTANRPRLNDIAPDGILIRVDWSTLEVGMSIFIPAIDVIELVAQVYEVAEHFDWSLAHIVRIEGGLWGVRFWRVV